MSGGRTNEELKEALDMIDMESYLDMEGITYKVTRGSSGTQLNVRECPVCGNNKWKVYLNVDTGLGNCFAGDHPPGENYNKWGFIKAHLGEDNRAVVEHILSIARDMGWRPKRKETVAIEATELKLPPSAPLPIDGKNLKYLKNRGIGTDVAQYFHLRYCHRGTYWYKDPTTDNWRGQNYDGRVIIPIFDFEGNLVSFQGRDTTGTADRKYLFPPGFGATGKLLYNGHNALAHRAQTIVVCEGVFDAMAVKIALDEDVALRDVVPIATFGKHLSHGVSGDDQLAKFLELKAAGLKNVIMMWDSETAALIAAVEAGKLLASIGLKVRIAVLPKDKDPNEVAANVVREAFYSALPLTRQNALKITMGTCWA